MRNTEIKPIMGDTKITKREHFALEIMKASIIKYGMPSGLFTSQDEFSKECVSQADSLIKKLDLRH